MIHYLFRLERGLSTLAVFSFLDKKLFSLIFNYLFSIIGLTTFKILQKYNKIVLRRNAQLFHKLKCIPNPTYLKICHFNTFKCVFLIKFRVENSSPPIYFRQKLNRKCEISYFRAKIGSKIFFTGRND